MPTTISPQDVLEFWFGHELDDVATAEAQARLWWSKDAEIDALIGSRFAPLVEDASNHRLDDWTETPRGVLACILLLDQFPRNIHRNSPQAFAYDHLALKFCLQGLEREWNLELRPIERVFFYLPLEHSEVLEYQERSVVLFGELSAAVRPEQRETFTGFLDFALRHRDIVARFGRFPHRNALLGRTSTTAEDFFLTQPGSSF